MLLTRPVLAFVISWLTESLVRGRFQADHKRQRVAIEVEADAGSNFIKQQTGHLREENGAAPQGGLTSFSESSEIDLNSDCFGGTSKTVISNGTACTDQQTDSDCAGAIYHSDDGANGSWFQCEWGNNKCTQGNTMIMSWLDATDNDRCKIDCTSAEFHRSQAKVPPNSSHTIGLCSYQETADTCSYKLAATMVEKCYWTNNSVETNGSVPFEKIWNFEDGTLQGFEEDTAAKQKCEERHKNDGHRNAEAVYCNCGMQPIRYIETSPRKAYNRWLPARGDPGAKFSTKESPYNKYFVNTNIHYKNKDDNHYYRGDRWKCTYIDKAAKFYITAATQIQFDVFGLGSKVCLYDALTDKPALCRATQCEHMQCQKNSYRNREECMAHERALLDGPHAQRRLL